MAQVGIVMGSDSDMPVMAKAADILEELGISYEMTILLAKSSSNIFSKSKCVIVLQVSTPISLFV